MNNDNLSHPILAVLLDSWTTDVIYIYVKLLDGPTSMRRKADRIDYICQQLLTPSSLHTHWQALDDISKRAVSTAYHNGGEFSSRAFLAQYEHLPERPDIGRYIYATHQSPILFDLFIIRGAIPADLLPLLTPLVLPEDRFQITPIEGTQLPKSIELSDSGPKSPLYSIETEMSGRIDLLTCLRMIEQGQISFSNTNHLITAGSIKKLHKKLLAGDFVLHPEKMTGKFVIRPFGLATFAYHSKFVTSRGNLSQLGHNYLKTQEPSLFAEAFEDWMENGRFEELSRVTRIKGLRSKKTKLTKPGERREKIIEALSWCPAGKWIHVYDLFRAIQAWDFNIALENTPFYNLSAEGYYWDLSTQTYNEQIVQPYIEIILVEYLATLGLIDIGYVDLSAPPYEGNSSEPSEIYDGFLYFRINDWGAYILGINDEYSPTREANQAKFTINQALQLTLTETVLPGDKLLVEMIALPLGKDRYQLDTVKMLDAIQSGQTFAHLHTFLVEGVETAVPELAAWLDQLRQNAKAIKQKQKAVIYTVNTTAMQLIESDEMLKKLATPLSPKTVLISMGSDSRFRKRLKELGYLIQG